MRHGRTVAWLGVAVALTSAVVALRQAQPPLDPPGPLPTRPVQVPRFAADGVVLPSPATRPTTVPGVLASRTGPDRVRVAWADGLPGGSHPSGATGYDVRWRATGSAGPGSGSGSGGAAGSGGSAGQRLVVAPEIELNGLATDVPYVIEVRTVNDDGRRSSPAVVTLAPLDTLDIVAPDLRRYTGLAEPFDGPFSVDSSVLAARWHLSGYPGCTRAIAEDGALTVDLACGADLAVLRSRAPLRLGRSGERGRVVLVTDGAGPRGSLSIDLVPGPMDRMGLEPGPASDSPRSPGPSGGPASPGPPDPSELPGGSPDPPAPSGAPGTSGPPRTSVAPGSSGRPGSASPGQPQGGSAADGGSPVDPALPDGAIRVIVDDAGIRVVTGPGVPRSTVLPELSDGGPATRGVGVLHTFELVFEARWLRILQDGDLVAVAGVVPPWTEAYLLVGLGGPNGQRARVRVDAVGFTGEPAMGPLTYAHPVVLATQRVLGTAEQAPGIGISRDRLVGARSARLVATVRTAPGMDLGGLQLQQGDTLVPARPVVPVPTAAGADVTVVSDLLPGLLGPDGPPAISPLVLRAPGAETTVVPITDSYLDIVPLTDRDLPDPARQPRELGQRPDTAVPRPAVAVLDDNSRAVTSVAEGARVVVHVDLDGLAGQLGGQRLAGVAGFQLWLSGRLIAGVPTAVDGPGTGGTYRVAVSTRSLPPGRQSLELRVIPADPTLSPASVLTSWHQL